MPAAMACAGGFIEPLQGSGMRMVNLFPGALPPATHLEPLQGSA